MHDDFASAWSGIMEHESHVRGLYIRGLRNLHAVEKEAHALLSRQIDRMTQYPTLEARLRTHLAETETQTKRLEDILERHGKAPSALKDAAMDLMGNLAALAHTVTGDEILKNTFANLAFENFEIASYKSLIVVADLAGAGADLALLEVSLREEEAMARFIDEQIEPTTRQYVLLAESGADAKI